MCGDNCPIEMGCCGCFGFLRKPQRSLVPIRGTGPRFSQEFLLPEGGDDVDGALFNADGTEIMNGNVSGFRPPSKGAEEILLFRARSGLICREIPVKETRQVIRTEVGSLFL